MKKTKKLQNVIDSMEEYTVGRSNISKIEISVLQMQRFINQLREISEEKQNEEEKEIE